MENQYNRPAFPNHKDTSGWSFPNHKDTSEWRAGITVRDYFAAKAMQGLMTMEDKGTYKSMEDCYSKIAELSYGVADAMLKQREL